MVPKSSIFRRFNRLSTRPAFPDSSNSSAAAAAAHAAHNGAAGSLGPGFGSLRAAGAAFGPARMGSSRPSRPAQLDPAVADGLAGGMDPQALSEMSHLSAAALLDRVRHSEDPAVVERVLTLVETVGVDEIAELWSDAEPDSLPGVLWRLYMLRTWMRSNRDSIAHLWRLGEPVATTASAIAGVDQAPPKTTSCDWLIRFSPARLWAISPWRWSVRPRLPTWWHWACAWRHGAWSSEQRLMAALLHPLTRRPHAPRQHASCTPPPACSPPPRTSSTVLTSGAADGWSNSLFISPDGPSRRGNAGCGAGRER